MSQKKKRDRAFSTPGDAKPSVRTPRARSVTDYVSQPTVSASASARWNREAIESVVVAIILAFLFRAFEAEAFVIPTGSMAPTLRGRYLSVQCEKCGNWHQVGASIDEVRGQGHIVQTICPMCQYPNSTVETQGRREVPSYPGLNGDRILVNKFAYDIADPKRWDVIVFKFPANAKQNFIKRLVGLPNETLRIVQGDVYTLASQQADFVIQRKPPAKVLAMLQPVHDTRFVAEELTKAGWPARWRPISESDASTWKSPDGGSSFQIGTNASSQLHWLRYQHMVPSQDHWEMIDNGEPVPTDDVLRPRPSLITDFYSYNAKVHQDRNRMSAPSGTCGGHWVGDLAVTCDLQVDSAEGEFVMELVESTHRFQCHFDIKTGDARLVIAGDSNAGDSIAFDGEESDAADRQARTNVRGAGKHNIKFSNVDNQILVWVDGKLVEFSGPTTYSVPARQRPQWSTTNAGDLSPIGIGIQGVTGSIARLQVHRDVYYVAVNPRTRQGSIIEYPDIAIHDELSHLATWLRNRNGLDFNGICTLDDYFRFPEVWREGDLFDRRQSEEFSLKADQFFPMGDNSPSSKDARLWEGPSYVERELLLGKAFMIYYPQGQISGFPGRTEMEKYPVINALPPDFMRMGLIR
ncbi:MAG: signal peptidase I [Planctomycetota bacterium]|nr:signal peptidase I [Planctomycetota bacterium]MDA1177979.1 signal peptidase I [Planctomycetota bacterium]